MLGRLGGVGGGYHEGAGEPGETKRRAVCRFLVKQVKPGCRGFVFESRTFRNPTKGW